MTTVLKMLADLLSRRASSLQYSATVPTSSKTVAAMTRNDERNTKQSQLAILFLRHENSEYVRRSAR